MTLGMLSYSRSNLPILVSEQTATFLLKFGMSGRGTISLLRYDPKVSSEPKATLESTLLRAKKDNMRSILESMGALPQHTLLKPEL